MCVLLYALCKGGGRFLTGVLRAGNLCSKFVNSCRKKYATYVCLEMINIQQKIADIVELKCIVTIAEKTMRF